MSISTYLRKGGDRTTRTQTVYNLILSYKIHDYYQLKLPKKFWFFVKPYLFQLAVSGAVVVKVHRKNKSQTHRRQAITNLVNDIDRSLNKSILISYFYKF